MHGCISSRTTSFDEKIWDEPVYKVNYNTHKLLLLLCGNVDIKNVMIEMNIQVIVPNYK